MENKYWHSFIEDMMTNYPLFFKGYTECRFSWDQEEDDRLWHEWSNTTCEVAEKYEIEVLNGQDKNAIISCDDDYVLKFSRNSRDMCFDEAIIYEKAVEEGVAQYFAECEFFESVDGIDFYLMERVEIDEDRVNEHSYFWEPYYNAESSEEASAWYSKHYWDEDSTETSLECFENVWGDISALRNFLDKYNINDLHQQNCGWIGELVKFIDYSGYCVSRDW